MPLQPGEIFIRTRRVHHQKKFFGCGPIDDQIVDDPAAFVQQKGTEWHVRVLSVLLVSISLSHPAGRRTGRDQLAHVRNIEDADVVSHRLVLIHDARVLHRHDPIAERDHLRAEPHMLLVERRFFCAASLMSVILDAAILVSTQVGAIDPNRPRAVAVNRPCQLKRAALSLP